MQKAGPLIRTKLRLPFTRPGLVSRPRLQEQIAQGLCCPLTLITDPAGFGKTTLVASCIAGCGMPAAWLCMRSFWCRWMMSGFGTGIILPDTG